MTKYLTADQVIAFHDLLIKNFGGLSGLRDKNLLHSALQAPKASFGGKEMYPSTYEKASTYLFHLARNHPFNDGNKRTAFVAVLVFLKANRALIKFKLKHLEQVVIDVADGKIDKARLAHFFNNKFIEQRWGLEPLSTRDAQANNLLNAFELVIN